MLMFKDRSPDPPSLTGSFCLDRGMVGVNIVLSLLCICLRASSEPSPGVYRDTTRSSGADYCVDCSTTMFGLVSDIV